MPWRAKPGCPKHHKAVVERIGNALPLSWHLPPQSGELFDSLDQYNRRLRGYAFIKGFDTVRQGEGTKVNPSWRFFYTFHGERTRNTKKLENKVERNKEGIITSKR
jgi:hypothetical protein